MKQHFKLDKHLKMPCSQYKYKQILCFVFHKFLHVPLHLNTICSTKLYIKSLIYELSNLIQETLASGQLYLYGHLQPNSMYVYKATVSYLTVSLFHFMKYLYNNPIDYCNFTMLFTFYIGVDLQCSSRRKYSVNILPTQVLRLMHGSVSKMWEVFFSLLFSFQSVFCIRTVAVSVCGNIERAFGTHSQCPVRLKGC